ncbi:MAG: ribonuclease III [Leptospirales bacterium]|nr:ribonuclease III [Leptospirales bacterium]
MGLRFFSRRTQPETSPDRLAKLKSYCKLHHIPVTDYSLIHQALLHSSYAHESKPAVPDNQRLEYLGDSVLSLIVNDNLFRNYPEMSEGKMARIKATLASEATLAQAARSIELSDVILLGRGEKQTGGKTRASILADALEAVIGAVYLERGWDACYKFVSNLLGEKMRGLASQKDVRDSKTRFQEFIQRLKKPLPVYETVKSSGPDHKPVFEVAVMVGGREVGRGKGDSRKKAEHQAAENALSKMKGKQDE